LAVAAIDKSRPDARHCLASLAVRTSRIGRNVRHLQQRSSEAGAKSASRLRICRRFIRAYFGLVNTAASGLSEPLRSQIFRADKRYKRGATTIAGANAQCRPYVNLSLATGRERGPGARGFKPRFPARPNERRLLARVHFVTSWAMDGHGVRRQPYGSSSARVSPF